MIFHQVLPGERLLQRQRATGTLLFLQCGCCHLETNYIARESGCCTLTLVKHLPRTAMVCVRKKAAARTAVIAIAGILASAAGSLQAADTAANAKPTRIIDFRTCAKPVYPQADLRANHTGTVTIHFLVAPDGAVVDTKIAKSSGHKGLDNAAHIALASCRFSPAANPSDEAVWVPVQYVWTLEGPARAGVTPMSRQTQEQSFLWAARVLARYRYKAMEQPANASAPVLDLYLKALDPDRALFTQADLAGFELQRAQLARNDDSKQLDAAFAIFEQMRTRRMAMLAWIGEALQGPLSALDGEGSAARAPDAPWPASDAERQALWRQHLANEVRSLRKAGAGDKEVLAALTRRHDKRLAQVRALGTRDAFEVFMNAYVTAFDPHGAYFPPLQEAPAHPGAAGEAGVGLVLKRQGEWVTVYDMVGEGAAWRSGQLRAGDRIVGVAQGADAPMTDVVGSGVEEVVAMLRGLPGSTVVLSVSPGGTEAGSPARKVALQRGAVSGPDNTQHAKAKLEVLERAGVGYRIAVVTIPSFYEDFAARRAGVPNYTSMTREVAEILSSMKAQGADAVLLDMRRNGGGSLIEAIGFTGLFLPRGAVAQQRATDGKLTIEFAPVDTQAWDGPLAVLIDEGSAAATEIFAAAMQDHGRGLVIGDRSVGRSSVQTLISLDRFSQNPSEKYGDLKMTVGQVFRVNGENFDQTGIVPDITIPGVPDPSGRAHRPGFPALPIRAATFSPRGDLKAALPVLSRRHAARATGGANAADIGRAQLGEALQVVGDQIELLQASPATAR